MQHSQRILQLRYQPGKIYQKLSQLIFYEQLFFKMSRVVSYERISLSQYFNQ